MILKLIALALGAAVSADVAVTAHEAFTIAKSPALSALGERMMPLDETNELRKALSDPDAADTHLKAALARNPYRTNSWIDLSVSAETRGDLAEARHDLEEASAHDAGGAPRWANANFYFRQGDEKQFLLWVNRYRAVTHVEEPGLFRMVAEEKPDVHALLASMPNLACDELSTLLDTVRERNLSPNEVVERMSSSCHDEASGKALAHLMSDFLRSDKPDQALQVRQRLGEDSTLINSSFSSPVTGEGFDWRVNVNGSIQVRQEKKAGIEFEFDDRVPSGTVLLFQPIALPPGSRYRLSMNLDSEPHEDEAFRWELVELSTGRHLASGLDDDNINRIPAWRFQVPQTSKTLALALFYKRTEGELPFQGTIDLQGVGLARDISTSPTSARK